jgi:hypothetical protein
LCLEIVKDYISSSFMGLFRKKILHNKIAQLVHNTRHMG